MLVISRTLLNSLLSVSRLSPQRRQRHELVEDGPHFLLSTGEGGVAAGILAIRLAARFCDESGRPFVATVFVQSDDSLEVKVVAVDAAKPASFRDLLPFGPVERRRSFQSILLLSACRVSISAIAWGVRGWGA